MDRPTFSVALCTYNGETFLAEQLDSLVIQSILPGEIVICDDGSTDGSIEVIEEFSRRSPIPVRLVVNQQRLGPARNFYKALSLCSGEWVFFCDQDDIWLTDRIERFSQTIERFPEANLIVSDGLLLRDQAPDPGHTLFRAFHLSSQEIDLINTGQAITVLARHVFATGAAMLVRRDWVTNIPEPQADYLHDEWLAWMAGSRMRVLDKPTFLYRQHAQQVTGVDSRIMGQIKRLFRPQAKASRSIDRAINRLEVLSSIQLEEFQPDALLTRRQIEQKIRFLCQRRELPENRLLRAFPILLKIGLAAYRRNGSGWRTVIKDLVQKGPALRE